MGTDLSVQSVHPVAPLVLVITIRGVTKGAPEEDRRPKFYMLGSKTMGFSPVMVATVNQDCDKFSRRRPPRVPGQHSRAAASALV